MGGLEDPSSAWNHGGVLDEADDEREEEALETDEPERLRCSTCRHPITDTGARFAVNGDHRHVCVNPSGIPYDIACFREAPGLRVLGPRTEAFTWFEGWAWQIGQCSECGAHLGWWFTRGEPSFAGLIDRRLVE